MINTEHIIVVSGNNSFKLKIANLFCFEFITFAIPLRLIIKSALVLVLAFKLWQASQSGYQLNIDREFFIFLAVGFIAEIVDGALGMAYGVICSSFLIYFGVPPALTSSAVHTSEFFTTGVSGLSHLHFKNVDKELFFKLVWKKLL